MRQSEQHLDKLGGQDVHTSGELLPDLDEGGTQAYEALP